MLSEFRVISRVLEATTAKRMQINPYCQQQKCSPVNVVSRLSCFAPPLLGVRKNVEFALRRHASNGSHVTVSQHVLSFLCFFISRVAIQSIERKRLLVQSCRQFHLSVGQSVGPESELWQND